MATLYLDTSVYTRVVNLHSSALFCHLQGGTALIEQRQLHLPENRRKNAEKCRRLYHIVVYHWISLMQCLWDWWPTERAEGIQLTASEL